MMGHRVQSPSPLRAWHVLHSGCCSGAHPHDASEWRLDYGIPMAVLGAEGGQSFLLVLHYSMAALYEALPQLSIGPLPS
ncbi:hypothetical protein BS17DRAFT_45738 [Gyrodon lividus]|nr:hypothetical protein BS17DRAFT_45738 [Gyrodon lividus]